MRFKLKSERGFTLGNLVITLSLMGILSAIAISNITEVNDPLVDATFQINHFLKKARAEAISDTQAVRISPVSSSRIEAQSSDGTCEDTMAAKNNLFLDLPDGASFSSTIWHVCFSQRGLANAYLIFDIENEEGDTKTIEVAIGGGVRIQ